MRRVVAFVLFVTGVVVGAGAGLVQVSATVDPAAIFPVAQISASEYHTCAVVSNGTAACWGYGNYGALGAGNNNGSNTPVAVTGGALANKTITQIDSARFHTCAVVSDGTVACWGLNQYGQLGTGISNNSNTPVAITGGALANKSVTQITTGAEHTCALISDGTVTCWGRNNEGQLGTGDGNNTNIPVAITGGALAGKTVTQITAGHSRTCAVVSDGTVACWGGGDSFTPVAVTGGALAGATVTKITAGHAHMCALISDGTVACWGQNIEGQLGTGDNTSTTTPVSINGGALTNKTVTSISAGAYHSCAVISNGTGACWGFNQSGQLGTGDTSDINTPVAITGGALTNKTITQIAGGHNYTCALISDGTATCWGDNSGGVLGTGNEVDSTIPVAVTGSTLANKTATQVTAGSQHTCALISDGSIVCSGWNLYGQLGTGDNTSTTTPVPINGGALTNKTVIQINAGIYHTCALISDGTVACWGENND
jgi:alpha-tubulin suppressor-like RCC1 family protein